MEFSPQDQKVFVSVCKASMEKHKENGLYSVYIQELWDLLQELYSAGFQRGRDQAAWEYKDAMENAASEAGQDQQIDLTPELLEIAATVRHKFPGKTDVEIALELLKRGADRLEGRKP